MHIFIDETGSFVLTNDFPSPSLVGALIIPDFQLAHVERRYEKLRKSFPKERGKVKGRLLDEKEISSVIAMLERNSVIYEVTSVEMSTHSVEGIEAYRSQTACGLTQNLTSEHHDNLVAEVWSLRHRLESLPIQLFVQTMATFNLLRRVIENATLYWCQRVPSELGKFAWIIDAKGNQNSPTAWERWWSTIVLPYMQANCLRKPIGHISWGDYSHMKKFETEFTPHLRSQMGEIKTEIPPIDIKLLLTDNLRFDPTESCGLELVDIITNATRRALTGRLEKSGWERIPRLMIHRRPGQYIEFIALEEAAQRTDRHYPNVISAFRESGRIMSAPRFREN